MQIMEAMENLEKCAKFLLLMRAPVMTPAPLMAIMVWNGARPKLTKTTTIYLVSGGTVLLWNQLTHVKVIIACHFIK